MGGPEEPKALAVKSDIQYIRCQVCEAMAKQAQRAVKTMREALTAGKKVRVCMCACLASMQPRG